MEAVPELIEAVTRVESGETRVENGETRVERGEKKTSKGLLFFYRLGNWVDNYLRKGIDTSYVDLPEHSWRVALTGSTLGINSKITSTTIYTNPVADTVSMKLYNRTTPSVDLGFNVGYRGFGAGYSWDLLHAYSRRISFSFGSKFIGVDFSYQTSSNINTLAAFNDNPQLAANNAVTISNANLSVWYALNAKHYSHNAATKQSYIQKKSAGSLLLHASYMSSHIELGDTIMISNATHPTLPSLMSGMTGMMTRQIAIGIGYGINYTPNKGKVLLHASATALLVPYSVNHISYHLSAELASQLPDGQPMYRLQSAYPVHVTGTVRAAISWEINQWVHLNAYATGEHIRFRSTKTTHDNEIALAEWNWKAQLTIAVRFGAGKDRVQRALLTSEGVNELTNERVSELETGRKKSRLPEWITDYFWSPKD